MKFALSTALLTGLASLASAQSPQMPGLDPNCNRYHYVQSGDTCAVIASINGISVPQFLSWNSEINGECTNLWLNYFVCTGVSATTSTAVGGTTATQTSNAGGGGTTENPTSTVGNGGTTENPTSTAGGGGTATTTGGSIPTNTSPAMPGLPASCWLFHTVGAGDTCEVIVSRYGISLGAFYAWNPEINTTCTNLWLGFAVCVGA